MNKKISLGLDKSKKYVIACSFGPDSMALLSLALNNGLDVVVAHVNYHKRDVSNLEQESLTKFCNEKNIKIEVLDTTGLTVIGNFQEWARETRYEFFKKVVCKYNAFGVLVAHQEDDLIETYLMQKNRGNLVKYWGICREIDVLGVKVIRPLLHYTKKELLEYDIKHKIPYSIDESNLTDHYARNKVRHSIVEKLTKQKRKAIILEIDNLNKKRKLENNKISYEDFQNLDYEDVVRIIDKVMVNCNEHRDLSEKFIAEIKKAFKNNPNCEFEITENVRIIRAYNMVLVTKKPKTFNYELVVNPKAKNEFIEVDFSMGAEDRGIKNENFPLFIRNLNPNEKIKVNGYYCEVRRLFIDWKMPTYLRKMWPGVYDKNDRLIYVPRYRVDFKDNHKSIFRIDLSKLFEN